MSLLFAQSAHKNKPDRIRPRKRGRERRPAEGQTEGVSVMMASCAKYKYFTDGAGRQPGSQAFISILLCTQFPLMRLIRAKRLRRFTPYNLACVCVCARFAEQK